MMQKIYFFTLLLLGLLTTNTTAQSVDLANQKSPDDWEVGGLLSINSFAGDLVSPKFSSLKATRFSLGGFGRMRISDPLHLRMGFSFGRLAASDLDFEDKQERGISFKKNMMEITSLLEWEPFNRGLFNAEGTFQSSLSPYFYTGMGLAIGKPNLDYENDQLASSTAAQQDSDNLKSAHFILPFGLGLKAYLTEDWTLGAEYGWRPVFNDYLEGVSQMGNPDTNDWYGMFSVMLARRLSTTK